MHSQVQGLKACRFQAGVKLAPPYQEDVPAESREVGPRGGVGVEVEGEEVAILLRDNLLEREAGAELSHLESSLHLRDVLSPVAQASSVHGGGGRER